MVYFPYEIDPRPVSREKELEFLRSAEVLGIEVSIHELAAACSLGNIDPQHTGGHYNWDGDTVLLPQTANECAAESALDFPLPPDGATLATVRLDVDSAAAMAILNIRAAGEFDVIDRDRVARIAAFDKFANSGVWSPLNEETIDWPLRILAQKIADFKVSIAERIEIIKQFLVGAIDFADAIPVAKAEWEQDKAQSKVEVVFGRVAFVESERHNQLIGYAHAPVVVAFNPRNRHASNPEPHAKFSVFQFAAGYADLQAVARELNELEIGWGGSPTFIGSPQGVASVLSPDLVVAIVEKHVK